MHPESWLKVMTASVVPVVIISACGLLCLAFYNRLASVVSRLRTFQRERLIEQERLAHDRRIDGVESDVQAATRRRRERLLAMLAEQSDRVTRRARLIRATLLCILGAVACLTLCSFFTGLSALWPSAAYPAAWVYLAGIMLLLSGVCCAIAELSRALDPVEIEVDFVDELAEELGVFSEDKDAG